MGSDTVPRGSRLSLLGPTPSPRSRALLTPSWILHLHRSQTDLPMQNRLDQQPSLRMCLAQLLQLPRALPEKELTEGRDCADRPRRRCRTGPLSANPECSRLEAPREPGAWSGRCPWEGMAREKGRDLSQIRYTRRHPPADKQSPREAVAGGHGQADGETRIGRRRDSTGVLSWMRRREERKETSSARTVSD